MILLIYFKMSSVNTEQVLIICGCSVVVKLMLHKTGLGIVTSNNLLDATTDKFPVHLQVGC